MNAPFGKMTISNDDCNRTKSKRWWMISAKVGTVNGWMRAQSQEYCGESLISWLQIFINGPRRMDTSIPFVLSMNCIREKTWTECRSKEPTKSYCVELSLSWNREANAPFSKAILPKKTVSNFFRNKCNDTNGVRIDIFVQESVAAM